MLPVVLLAGGLSTRLRPLTETIPKAMVDIAGKPFIYHQLRLLKSRGIERVILCLGYLGERIEEYIGDGSDYQLEVAYSYDGEKLLGTGGALRRAERYLDDAFFILYGDSYLDISYKDVEAAYHVSGKKGLMTVYKNDGKWDTSNVVFQDNQLIQYSKRERSDKMSHIDYGLGILRKTVLAGYKAGSIFDLADVYESLVKEGQLAGYEASERFYEIGSKTGIEELSQKIGNEIGNRQGHNDVYDAKKAMDIVHAVYNGGR